MLKWPGGKWRLLGTYAGLLPRPDQIRGYREVCLGGGAVFFGLYSGVRPTVLADVQDEVMDVYRAIQRWPAAVVAGLASHAEAFLRAAKEGRGAYVAHYNRLRAEEPSSLSLLERAVRTIALNKTTVNGLFRKNGSGQFNAPCGVQEREDGSIRVPTLCKPDNVHRVARALRGAMLLVSDLVPVIDGAQAGELVLADVPYDPIVEGGFVDYTAKGFDWNDQIRTAQALRRAANRGAYVAASNHDTPRIRELYAGFDITAINVRHAISPTAAGRGFVGEVLIRNFTRVPR